MAIVSDDDNVIKLIDRLPQPPAHKPPALDELNSKKIRDLAAKAVIYPQTVSAKQVQELGAAVLTHLKKYYGSTDG